MKAKITTAKLNWSVIRFSEAKNLDQKDVPDSNPIFCNDSKAKTELSNWFKSDGFPQLKAGPVEERTGKYR